MKKVIAGFVRMMKMTRKTVTEYDEVKREENINREPQVWDIDMLILNSLIVRLLTMLGLFYDNR